MTQPTQNPNIVVPTVPPAIRVPAQDDTIQATNEALQSLLALLGSPAQDGNLASILLQLSEFGAQPWVPNIQSASLNLQGPGFYDLGVPAQNYRVWGGYITGSARASSGYGPTTDAIYGRVFAAGSPQLQVAHIELALAAPSTVDSNTNAMQIPGMPMPAGTKLRMDVNGNISIAAAVIRMTGNIFYSIP